MTTLTFNDMKAPPTGEKPEIKHTLFLGVELTYIRGKRGKQDKGMEIQFRTLEWEDMVNNNLFKAKISKGLYHEKIPRKHVEKFTQYIAKAEPSRAKKTRQLHSFCRKPCRVVLHLEYRNWKFQVDENDPNKHVLKFKELLAIENESFFNAWLSDDHRTIMFDNFLEPPQKNFDFDIFVDIYRSPQATPGQPDKIPVTIDPTIENDGDDPYL